jgi:hypothetical protein
MTATPSGVLITTTITTRMVGASSLPGYISGPLRTEPSQPSELKPKCSFWKGARLIAVAQLGLEASWSDPGQNGNT